MEIQRTSNSPAFRANFIKNKAFVEAISCAKEQNCLRTVDSALNNIKKSNCGNIMANHGYTPDGKIYSNFICGRRSVVNYAEDAKTPAEATLNGIIELGALSKKYRSLMGTSNPEQKISVDSIIKEYTA